MNRVCKKCNQEKPIDQFYKHSCGYRHDCKTCVIKKASKWSLENPEKRLEIVRKSRANPNNAWKSYRSEWRKASGDVAKRRASQAHRTPEWLTKDDLWMIKEIYSLRHLRQKLTGIKWHVDHIIPLRGKFISGLHVPWNMQVITATQNMSKSNSVMPETCTSS